MWSEPQRGRKREKERRIFFTLSAQFPFYFLPEDPCLQNVQRMLSTDRRLWNLPEQKKSEKKESEKDTPPPSCTAMQKDGVITQKILPPCFFHFLSRSSRNTELLLRPEYLDRTPVIRSQVEEKKKQMVLIAKCIGLYFCATSRLIGVHVRQPIVDWVWGSIVGRNIRAVEWSSQPGLPVTVSNKCLAFS